uniref:IRG-type G domain-containing protein n=1 Tax=Panagrolaimus davidi TaxID=227884 RepID=A0A914Q2S7_9BILA
MGAALAVLSHPVTLGLTGFALQAGNSCSLGLGQEELLHMMPNQRHFITRMADMDDKIEAERVLTKKYQETLKLAKNRMKDQMRKAGEMDKYMSSKPKKNVKVDEEYKISAAEAAEKNGVDNVNFVNFAFVGHTNNGKSSLINAIRGLSKDDKGAAKVDILECTPTIKFYTCPNGKMPNVRFYDVPGSGSMTHQAANYYGDKALCGFDCLVILVQQTLGEEEVKFAKAALDYNQKVVFVRSKCDIDFHLKDESGKTSISIPSPEQNELRKHDPRFCSIQIFFISAKSMRALIRAEPSDLIFEEAQFLEYLYQQSKKARGIYV